MVTSFICPVCGEDFETKHESFEGAYTTNDMESREQWISQTCSDKYWDETFKEKES